MAVKSTKKKKAKKNKKTLPESQHRELVGIFLWVFAFLLFFSLSGSAGVLGTYLNLFLASLFGVGAFLIPFVLLGAGAFYFFSNHFRLTFHRVLGISIFVFSVLALIHMRVDFADSYTSLADYGGIVGFTLSYIFRSLVGDPLSWFIFLGLFFSSIPLIVDLSFKEIFQKVFKPISEVKIKSEEAYFEDAEIKPMTISKPKLLEIEEKENPVQLTTEQAPKQLQVSRPDSVPLTSVSPAPKKKAKKDSGIKISNFTGDENWEFPSIELLSNESSNTYPDDKYLEKQALNIQAKLAQFGINVEVVEARVGPTVTQFTLNPAEGVKISKILSLKDDLALALSAKSVRIEAPIPGQPYVGIETPNEDRATVHMREILESENFKSGDSKLKLAVGKDVSGNAVVEDLAKMPHLLIAGATGSGKSVGMNSFLISLLYQNSPRELKFIMIDPKRVELTGYNGIPHLLTPVITEADKALAALKWSVSEMMRRYTECQEKGYRNIAEYNEAEEKKMPKIVIVIDELADLMMREFKKETEASICRLAQMARAVGMHLIIATQRPSVDVITGLIKANVPTRMSFTVTSSIDSRTILDSVGAEDLLGMGDLLYINASLSKPKRIQGIYISSKEIEKVTNHIKVTPEPEGDDDLIIEEEVSSENIGELDLDALSAATDEDDKIPEAIEAIRKSGKASATLLQRMLGIGYARAAKILDILEEKGFVGPANGAKPREIYMDTET